MDTLEIVKPSLFSLLGENIPVIAIVSQDNTYEAMPTNIKEVKARVSPLIVVAQESEEAVWEIADSVIEVPRMHALSSPVVNTIALQLLAYYTAREISCAVDFPRNLAKSVTVE